MPKYSVLGALFTGGFICLSCSGASNEPTQLARGGQSSLGGSMNQGGALGGGAKAIGGSTTSTLGGKTASGGSSSAGGTDPQGGALVAGGSTARGGNNAYGGGSSGGVASGGVTAKGGGTSAGGAGIGGGNRGGSSGSANGGSTAKGGNTSTGNGGSSGSANGGSTAKGGSASTGGTVAFGGSNGTGGSTAVVDPRRYRIMWSSDFPPIPVTNSDPDDVQTVIRLVLYSNELEVEGFIASAGTYAMVANKSNYETIWAAYDKVYQNLQKHDAKYPTPAAMRAMTYEGKGNNNGVRIAWECNKQPATNLIGTGKESEASAAIIAAVDKPDPRPLWIGVAGGPREVAQAIWTVRNTRSEAEAKTFISKLRVFLIHCQDSTDQYIMSVPGLFVIDSKSSYASFCCGNDALCNLTWTNANIRTGHGPLGAIYPERGVCSAGVAEGDSPAFMHLVSAMRGINNPEVPSEPGWGGQYKQGSDNKWTDGGAGKIVSGRATYQAEFALRADWMVQ